MTSRILPAFALLALAASGCGGGEGEPTPEEQAAAARRRNVPREGELPDPFAGMEAGALVGALTPEELVETLGSNDYSRQMAAYDRLLALGSGAQRVLLEKGLAHQSPKVRANAAAVLGKLGDSGGGDVVEGLLKCAEVSSDSFHARRMAIWALGRLRILDSRSLVEMAAPQVFGYLDSPDAEVRSHAAQTLRIYRHRDAVERLIGMLDESREGNPTDPIRRNYVRDALRDLTHEDFGLDAQKWADWWAGAQSDRDIFGS
ncbi:MAG: HEAT repeat domain-containing protein [Planctomycetales bacterium]|nr:HEAT repeat domain-containing protein [Planctomycetales bacterium]